MSNRWFAFRVVLVGVGLWPTDTSFPVSGFQTFGDLAVLAAAIVVTVIVLVVAVVGTARLGKRASHTWHRPSWFRRPIFGEPLQFFHAMSFFAMATDLSGAYSAREAGGGRLATPIIVIASGFGVWLAVHLCVLMFRGAFVSGDEEPGATSKPSLPVGGNRA